MLRPFLTVSLAISALYGLSCTRGPESGAPTTGTERPVPVAATAGTSGPLLDVGEPDPLLADAGGDGVTPVPGAPGLVTVARRTEAWGSFWTITVATRNAVAVDEPVSRCFDELRRLEPILSEWLPDSEVSRVNAAAGSGPVKVSAELLDVVGQALEVSRLTGGAFDPTFGPLGRLWRVEDPAFSPPADDAVKAARARVGAARVRIDDVASTLHLEAAGMELGLGGIAQGFWVDRCGAMLRKAGLTDFVVDGSGDLLVAGRRGPMPWRAGIAHPRRPGTPFTVVDLPPGAMVTSGDYHKSVTVDGRRYHHIIDPATGRPVDHTSSVTVFAPTAARADALATGLLVLGVEKGMALVRERAELEAVMVATDGTVHVSPGLAGRVAPTPKRLDMTAPGD